MKIDPRLKEDLKEYIVKKMKEEGEKLIITSATRLSKEDLAHIQKTFSHMRITSIEQHIDESVLGGVILEQGTRMVDLSLRGLLQKLRHDIHEVT